jgi:hypothetical protein
MLIQQCILRVIKILTDLILDDGVPGVFCKFAHRVCVYVISLISNDADPL